MWFPNQTVHHHPDGRLTVDTGMDYAVNAGTSFRAPRPWEFLANEPLSDPRKQMQDAPMGVQEAHSNHFCGEEPLAKKSFPLKTFPVSSPLKPKLEGGASSRTMHEGGACNPRSPDARVSTGTQCDPVGPQGHRYIAPDVSIDNDLGMVQPLKLLSAVTIPKRSAISCSAFFHRLPGVYAVEPDDDLRNKSALLVQHCLVEVADYKAQIVVWNMSEEMQTIQAGTLLGHARCKVYPEEIKLIPDGQQGSEARTFVNSLANDEPSNPWEKFINVTNPKVENKMLDYFLKKLMEVKGVLPTSERPIGRYTGNPHEITTKTEKPITCKPHRISPHHQQAMKEVTDEMVRLGLAEPTISPWTFPCILVKKQDGGWQVVADFRKLNKITERFYLPLPDLQVSQNCMAGASWFVSLDLTNNIWQIPLTPQSRKKASFCTPFGNFQYNVMAYGLCNGASIFQAIMNETLSEEDLKICLTFLDSCLIYARTFEELVDRTVKVLGKMAKVGLTIRPEKCTWLVNEITFLGHRIFDGTIEPDTSHLEAIAQFPLPRNTKDLRCFVGMCEVYQQYVKYFAHITRPLHQLLKTTKSKEGRNEEVPFTWTEECTSAFCKLRTALMSRPVLSLFHPGLPVQIRTDACDYGVAAILLQQHNTDVSVWRPVAYFSKRLNKAQIQIYTVSEKELYAIVMAIQRFRNFLNQSINVVTDHSALVYLDNMKDTKNRLIRWAIFLSQYEMICTHRKGKLMEDADCLSRYPILPPQPEGTESIIFPGYYQTCLMHNDKCNLPKPVDLSRIPKRSLKTHSAKAVSSTESTSSGDTASTQASFLRSEEASHSLPYDPFNFTLLLEEDICPYTPKLKWGSKIVNDFRVIPTDKHALCLAKMKPRSPNVPNRNSVQSSLTDNEPEVRLPVKFKLDKKRPEDDNSSDFHPGVEPPRRMRQKKQAVTPTLQPIHPSQDPSPCDWANQAWLIDEQNQDEFCQTVKTRLLNPADPTITRDQRLDMAKFVVINDDLYRLVQDKAVVLKVIVVPNRLKIFVLQECHDSLASGGHSGYQATYRKVITRFWFTHMPSYIEKYIQSCQLCETNNMTKRAPQGFLRSILGMNLFETWGIDVLGPLPISNQGFKYVIVATEYKSRWAIARPAFEVSRHEICNFFVQDICHQYGFPLKLISDRGSQFISQTFADLLQFYQIKHAKTTAFSPWQNGLTEVFNKDLCHKLSKWCNEKQNDWDVFIPMAAWNHNVVPNSSTGFAPFEVLFGRRPRFPIDIIMGTDQLEEPENIDDFVKDKTAKMREMHDLLDMRLEHRARRSAERHDKNIREFDFNVGDPVFLYDHSQPKGKVRKLMHLRTAGWIIEKIISERENKISKGEGQNRKTKVVNVRYLEHCRPQDQAIAKERRQNDTRVRYSERLTFKPKQQSRPTQTPTKLERGQTVPDDVTPAPKTMPVETSHDQQAEPTSNNAPPLLTDSEEGSGSSVEREAPPLSLTRKRGPGKRTVRQPKRFDEIHAWLQQAGPFLLKHVRNSPEVFLEK